MLDLTILQCCPYLSLYPSFLRKVSIRNPQQRKLHERATLTMCSTLCVTDPEVSHGVDLHCLLNQGIRSIHKFLSCHDPSIVHQNADVTNLSLHLHGAKKNVIYEAI